MRIKPSILAPVHLPDPVLKQQSAPRPLAALASKAGLALAGLMVSLPFLNPWHYYPIATFYEEWLAFLLGLLASLALLAPRLQKGIRLPQTSLWLPAFAALLILQIPLGNVPYPQTVLIGALYVLWAALMIVVGDRLREELGIETAVRALAWFLLGAALISSLLAIIQFYRLETPLSVLLVNAPRARATANLGQPNWLANLLALGVGCAIYLRIAGRLRFVWFAAATLLLLVAMSLTVSRAGTLLVMWIVLTAWWGRRGLAADRARRLSRSAFFVFAVFAAAQVLIFEFDLLGTQLAPEMTLIGRFHDLGSPELGEHVYSVRFFLWRQAWQVFLAHPLLGIGWGQLAWGIFSQLDTAPGWVLLAHEPFAHNLPLQLLAETGITGAAPVMGALGVWLWRRLRQSQTPEGWWILALASAELVYSMIEFPLWYSPFLGVLALLVGLGESRWFAPKLQRLLPFSMIALLVFSAVTLVRTWQDYSKLWVWLYVSLGVRQDQSESLRPRSEVIVDQLGRSLLVPYMDLPLSSVIGMDHNNLKEKIIFHERVMRFTPTPYVVYRHVLLLALDGREADAMKLLDHAMRLYPSQIDSLLQAAASLPGKDTGAVLAVVTAARAELKKVQQAPGAQLP